jgi:hypothetical protein
MAATYTVIRHADEVPTYPVKGTKFPIGQASVTTGWRTYENAERAVIMDVANYYEISCKTVQDHIRTTPGREGECLLTYGDNPSLSHTIEEVVEDIGRSS